MRLLIWQVDLGSHESLFDAVPTPLVLVAFEDDEPIVQRVNRAFEDTFGIIEEELVGSSLDGNIAPNTKSEEAKEINQTLQQCENVRKELTRETAQDRTRTFLLEAAPVGQDGSEALGTYTDITERKRAEVKQQLLSEVSQSIGEASISSMGTPSWLRNTSMRRDVSISKRSWNGRQAPWN